MSGDNGNPWPRPCPRCGINPVEYGDENCLNCFYLTDEQLAVYLAKLKKGD
jgi:hypothetical protein